MLQRAILLCVFSHAFAGPHPAALVDLQLDVGDPGLYVVRPGDATPLALTATNSGHQAVKGMLVAEVESYDGSSFTVSGSVDLRPGETARVEIPRERLGDLGIKWVHAELRPTDMSEPVKKELAFAYMEPAGNRGAQQQEMLLAIAYGAGPDNRSETAAVAASRVGVGLLRALMHWNSEETDFDDLFTNFRAHRKHGVEPYLLVTRTAPFARLPGPDGKAGPGSAPDPTAWRDWIRQLAQAIRQELPDGQEVYWEIWNEPDIGFFTGTTEQYLEMLDIAHEEIERVGGARFHVMTGGFASLMHAEGKEGMIERVITEAEDDWELVAYHEHGTFPKFVRGIEEHLQPVLDRADRSAPVFLTETGMDTRHGEHFQARELIKKIVYSWARGFRAYTWFNLHDMPQAKHARQPGFTYGLYTQLLPRSDAENSDAEEWDYENTYPKAAYVALNTLSTVMNGLKRQGQIELPDDQFAYAFADEDRRVIVAWDQSPSGVSTLRLIPTDADRAEWVDLMGNASAVPVVQGMAVLEVGPAPGFLVLHGAKRPVEAGPAFATTAERPDGPAVALHNPFSRPIEVSYQWEPVSMFRLVDETSVQGALRLQPGERQVVATAMTLESDREFSLGSTLFSRLHYELAPFGVTGVVEVPHVLNAVSVPLQYRPWASIVLEEQAQVVNRFEHDPHTAHLMWSSWRDNSAEVRLARKDGALTMKLDVLDDHHHAEPDEVVDGDGVIIGLNVPGQQGSWRWAISDRDGAPRVRTLETPQGRDASIQPEVKVEADRLRTYEVIIDEAAVGIEERHYRTDLRFNVTVVDHDGEPQGVESFLHAAPITEAAEPDPADWPRLVPAS